MSENAKQAFEKASLGAQNNAYDIIAELDPEYFEKLKGLYVDGTFGREGALPRKTKELIMIGITCALSRPRGVRLHSERALALGATPHRHCPLTSSSNEPRRRRSAGRYSRAGPDAGVGGSLLHDVSRRSRRRSGEGGTARRRR